MRRFVVVGHEAPTTHEFSLDDLTGAGRLDLLCRAAGSALFLSHDIRRDVAVSLVCQDELTITLTGAELRNAGPDERTLAGLLRRALEHRDDAIGHQPVQSSPGVALRKQGLAATLDRVEREGAAVVQLHGDGDPLPAVGLPEEPAFVLSDHRAFTGAEAELLAERAERRVSLGPEALHADHAISVVQNYVDTAGWERY